MENYKGFAVSVRGHSHVVDNKECQDFSLYEVCREHTILAVSDGHGSDKYCRSAVGSKIAVESARECLNKLMIQKEAWSGVRDKGETAVKKLLQDEFVPALLAHWNEGIRTHFEHCTISPREAKLLKLEEGDIASSQEWVSSDFKRVKSLYGCTLVAAVVTNDFWFAISIGDCNCFSLYVNNQQEIILKEEIDENEKNFLNVTTSLSSSDPSLDFRFAFGCDIPLMLALSSDGIYDSLGSKAAAYKFFQENLYESGAESESRLKEFLPKLSEKGNGDDMSVAVVWVTKTTDLNESHCMDLNRNNALKENVENSDSNVVSDSYEEKNASEENVENSDSNVVSVSYEEKNAGETYHECT